MGGLIAGIAVSTLVSAISGAMGAQAQKEAYDTMASASEQERAEFKAAYDQAFGPDSYNAKMQQLGEAAGQQFYDRINDGEAWDRYVSGDRAYVAPEAFSFTAEDLFADPSYQVRKQEGLDALDQSNVTAGLNLSGAAVKATNDYAQDQASKEYAAEYSRKFGEYRDKRDFDFNAWKQEANQYYANLQAQLAGLDNVSKQGVQANTNQTRGLEALANNNAAAIQAQATAQAGADMADTSAVTSVLDAIAKGLNTGVGLYASKSGATPTSSTPATTSPTNTYTLSGNLNNGQQNQDFANLFLLGWNPSVNTSVPTTQNLLGV